MNKMKYAGIGARETPIEICNVMTALATKLESFGYKLQSGGADGADKAFAAGCKDKTIFIPWRGFNNIQTIHDTPSELAIETAERFHPAWNKLGSSGKLLQARNSHILLGEDCKSPVDFVIAWTPGGRIVGGTGQGLRIAEKYKILTYNLAKEVDMQKLSRFIAELK